MSKELNRRQFLGRAVAGGAAVTAGVHALAPAAAANDRVVVGVAGMGRGGRLAVDFAQQPGCVVKYACDVDRRRAAAAAAAVEEAGGRAVEPLGDLRHMLDDPEVDAVVFALPAHWHAPATIMACQAGKHVYVEKPCSHNPHEGELMIKAARAHNRVVQMGNQRRSSVVITEAMDKLHDGAIGRCYYVRSWYAAQRGSIGTGRDAPVPEYLDYELWQGPAPRRPFRPNVVHYNWHWLWHWGTGELGNNGTHVIDLCRWGLEVDYPVRVAASGGRFRFDDDQETPDTHLVSYDFDGDKMISWEGLSCNVPGSGGTGFGATFYGEDGSLTLGSAGYIMRDAAGKVIEEHEGDVGDIEHIDNFLAALRQDNAALLNSEIEEGHKSTLLAHLGNIAQRTGRTLQCGPQGHILDDADAQAYWQRDYEPGWEPVV